MAIEHAEPGEVIPISPLGDTLHDTRTRTLVKTDDLLILRMVLPAGKVIDEHHAPGPITVQCIEGQVEFHAHGAPRTLDAGTLLYLNAGEPHSLHAITDASVLLTMILRG